MRLWFSGPRIFGLRSGISLGREDFARFADPQRGTTAGGAIDPDHSFVYVIKADNGLCKIGRAFSEAQTWFSEFGSRFAARLAIRPCTN
jgi:hypothetical protein